MRGKYLMEEMDLSRLYSEIQKQKQKTGNRKPETLYSCGSKYINNV